MTDPNQPDRYRFRLIFAKKTAIKYISHLDLVLAWERALRRAQIPLAYSQGYNPRPKMQFASGLPLGTTGAAEMMDIIVTESLDRSQTLEHIKAALPMGLTLHSIEEIPLKWPAMQPQLRQANYRVVVETDLPAEALTQRIETLLAAEEIMETRRRKGKIETFDMRPWLHQLQLERLEAGDATLQMRVTAGQSGNLRPESVLKALGLADNWAEIERTRLIFEKDLPEESP